jgi:hypothetical protein
MQKMQVMDWKYLCFIIITMFYNFSSSCISSFLGVESCEFSVQILVTPTPSELAKYFLSFGLNETEWMGLLVGPAASIVIAGRVRVF